MPVMRCRKDGKPGWKFGDSGFCYTYMSGSKRSQAVARLRAAKQGAAQHINR